MRARKLSSEIRCPICKNETIDSSSTHLAHDLRWLIRQKLLSGATDRQIIDFFVKCYGDYILLKPNFSGKNLLLWLSPLLILLSGTFFVFASMRTKKLSPAPLTIEEEKRLKIILQQDPMNYE